MKKVTTLFLMLFLILSGALCYAHGAARTENKKVEGSILIKQKVHHGGTDKSGSIVPSINGNTLTVVFCENLGQVAIEITNATGNIVQTFWMSTPNGLQTELYLTGDYVITFTLPNGDEYYGEFTVTN